MMISMVSKKKIANFPHGPGCLSPSHVIADMIRRGRVVLTGVVGDKLNVVLGVRLGVRLGLGVGRETVRRTGTSPTETGTSPTETGAGVASDG